MFKNFFRRSPPLKDTLDDTIIKLNKQRKKLELLSGKIKGRERTLYESCTQALERKDSEKAKIFANELTEVKKVSKTVNNGMLLLEQLTIRMDTLREIGSTFAQLQPTLEVVKQISGQLAEVMPEVSNELSSIGSVLGEAIVGMSIEPCNEMALRIPDSLLNDQIIEEASNLLRDRIEDEIPIPPIAERRAPAIMIGGEEELVEMPVSKVVTNITENMGGKEGAVLVYLRTNGGEFDLGECSSSCNVHEDEIPTIIEGLSRKGLIKIMTV